MADEGTMAAQGVVRWAFNTTLWTPSDAQFHAALALLPPSEWTSVLRFSSQQDRKQALVSRLMQRKLIHDVMGVEFENICIERTPEGKPYLANQIPSARFPDLCFNVSHHGDYVVIVSDPVSLVGVDIVTHDKDFGLHPKKLFALHVTSFTPFEWETIHRGGPDPCGMLDQFYRHWCMKEAYIKALGIGVGFELHRAEFHYHEDLIWGDIAYVYIDGIHETNWQFFLHKLDGDHWICVARGRPPTCAMISKDMEDVRPCISTASRDTSFTSFKVENVLKQIWNYGPFV